MHAGTIKAVCTKKAIFFIGIVLILLILYNTVRITSREIVSEDITIIPDNESVTDSVVTQSISTVKSIRKTNTMKYILQWTNPKNVPFVYMGEGTKGFVERNCPYQNCIVTANRMFLGDYSKFDVIAFAGPEVTHLNEFPKRRSPHQKYVFASIESSDYYPMCSNNFDGYFNWTWTFKLDSEIQWGYMTIRDKDKNIVGPKKEMHWIKVKDMDPVSEDFKKQLQTKSKAAAWFVSNCRSVSRREIVVTDIIQELKKYDLTVDIYGNCGTLQCSRKVDKECDNLIKVSYYFYLSFENSFSEDYVTEKLLRALHNDAIPIVYGGANYTRFMPDGIYLNARELTVEQLAAKMNELINDPEQYAQYFKWRNHYSYHFKSDSVETDPYCLFCAHLNDEKMVQETTIYKDFRKWWDPPERCKFG